MDVVRSDQVRAKRHRRRLIFIVIGVLVVALAGVALLRLDPAAPAVDRDTFWVDEVRRGPMVREVRGIGTLQPEEIRFLTAATTGTVEFIPARPGVELVPGTLIVRLNNPQLVQEAENARLAEEAAAAGVTSLRAELEGGMLDTLSRLAQLEGDLKEAQLQAQVNEQLFAEGLVAELTLQVSRLRAEELARRHEIETRRVAFAQSSLEPQMARQNAELDQARSRRELLARQQLDLEVRATEAGVLQRLSVEVGQTVTLGQALAQVADVSRLQAVIRVPETLARDIVIGQPASVDTRNGIIPGRVARIDPTVEAGTVAVDVSLEGPLPRGARPDQTVEGRIELDNLADVLFVGRPASARENATIGLFRLLPGSDFAERVQVQFGRSSVTTIEVIGGLQPGDRVILSETSQWDRYDRLRLK